MKSKIGLLPFYLELYDKAMPEKRAKAEKFYRTITVVSWRSAAWRLSRHRYVG